MNRYAVVAAAMFYAAAVFAVPPQHVIIIGCDGMSPDGVTQANTPFMDGMMREGAWTLHARGVMPTSSSPNWASMIMGAGPEQHGVTSNDWEIDKFEIAPTVKDDSGRFPTIFALLKQQKPGATGAVFHDWDGFGRLLNRSDVVEMQDCDGPAKTTEAAIAYIKEHKPTLTFIHLDHVDHAGHEVGHGTPEYYAAVE
ncbi:MAG: alkaline phosphatase, partial [Candidatus Hydrogenedentota bacterium]